MAHNNVLLVKNDRKRFLLIQPAIFTVAFVNGMTANVLTDMIIFRTCKQITRTNKNNCDIIHTNSSSEEAVELIKIIQIYASSIIISKKLIESILPSLIILFLGSWSDKVGRKPLLIGGSFAPMCDYIILSILSLWDLNPWICLIAYIPSAVLGSGQTLAAYCYASDISEFDKRPMYLASMTGCLSAGVAVGTFTGPLIFHKLNYTFLFTTAASLCAISLLYILFLIPETLENKSDRWDNPFNWSLVKQLIVTCTKKRDCSNCELLWSFLLILSLYTVINDGTKNINYLFTTTKFGWSAMEFSTYSSLTIILTVVGTIIGLKVIQNCLDLNDFAKASIGCLSGFAAAITYSLSWKSWHMYLGTSLGVLTGIILPITQSAISKSVLVDDLGKVFSVVTFIETILPLGSSPLYFFIYSSFIEDYPSSVFLLSASMFFFMIIITRVMNLRFARYNISHSSDIHL